MCKETLKDYIQKYSKYPFIKTYNNTITFSGFWKSIETYAKKLSSLENKRVGIISVPSPETLSLICTLVRLNTQIVLLSPFDPPSLINKYIKEIQASVLFCEDFYSNKYKESPIPVIPIKNIQNIELDVCQSPSSSEECKFIIMTSGSSSTPKKVLLTLNNLLTNAHYSNQNLPFREDDAWLLSLPLFHVSGLSILFRAIEGGGSIFIPSENIRWWETDIPSEITHLSVVSTIMKRLLDRKDCLTKKKWKGILLGGGPIPRGIVQQCYDMGLPIYTTYGLTEMSSQVTTTCQNDSLSHLLTSGKPLISDTVKIREDGNIHVRGPCRFQGYFNDDTLEQPFDKDGWFATQDIGQWAEDGYLQVLGRKDNVFICGGENIQPEEIETEIMSSGFVNKVVVVPMPNEEYGNIPVAFVEFSESSTEDKLKNYLKEKIPGIKIPKYFLPFPHELEERGIKTSRKALKNWINNQNRRLI